MKKMFSNKNFVKTIIAFLILIFVFASGGAYFAVNVRHAYAKTIVNHWTFSDNSVHLEYKVTEYKDGTFAIEEYYFGSLSRYITGRVYVDAINGHRYAKSIVDSDTLRYWNSVTSNYEQKKNIEWWSGLADFILICFTPWGEIKWLDYIRNALSAVNAAEVYINEHSGLATDTDKTIYEMACASDAAWHLVNNPHVIVPSIKKPRY